VAEARTKPDPAVLVRALRILVDVSNDTNGPNAEVATASLTGIDVPDFWVEAVLAGWHKFGQRYERAFATELDKGGKIRFLRANLLPDLKFEDSDRICRLCGFACQAPSRTWHPACWAAFEPETAVGWKRITKEALKKCGWHCESCGVDLKELKKQLPYSGRRTYDVDHKIPLFKGGAHSAENVQILCVNCHKQKTQSDRSVSDDWANE
jgi:hypothetical protein